MKIEFATILRTVLQVAAITALVLTQSGIAQVDDVANAFVVCTTIVITTINWWKNNSFTDAALAGDALKDFLKRQERDADEDK